MTALPPCELDTSLSLDLQGQLVASVRTLAESFASTRCHCADYGSRRMCLSCRVTNARRVLAEVEEEQRLAAEMDADDARTEAEVSR